MLDGVTATCAGKSRLLRLNRLARNTCGPAIGRPLYQKNAMTAATIAAAATNHSVASPRSRRTSFIGHARTNCIGSGDYVRPSPRVLSRDFARTPVDLVLILG